MPSTAIKPKPRTKPAEIRRNELMAAAEALFLEKGFAATSVDEIVRLADVAKGTFYLHFRSKDDMLIALRQRFIDRFCEGLEQQLNNVQSMTGRESWLSGPKPALPAISTIISSTTWCFTISIHPCAA